MCQRRTNVASTAIFNQPLAPIGIALRMALSENHAPVSANTSPWSARLKEYYAQLGFKILNFSTQGTLS